MTLMASPSATSSPASEFGASPCDALGGLTIGQFGQCLVPANLSARQARALGLLTSGIYGPPPSTLSRSDARSASLANRLRVLTASAGSTLYNLTWKVWTTPQGRSLSRLRGSVRRTSGTERTGWPTPTTPSGGQVPPEGTTATGLTPDGRKVQVTLKDVAHMAGWPTPMAGEPATENYNEAGNTDSSRKTAALASWNTPIAPVGRPGGPNQAGGALSRDASLAGWRTPTACTPNSLRGAGRDPEEKIAKGRTVNLQDEVRLAIHPGPARLTARGEMLTGSSAGMDGGGQLDPAHSFWLMGLPIELLNCAPPETPSRLRRRRRS